MYIYVNTADSYISGKQQQVQEIENWRTLALALASFIKAPPLAPWPPLCHCASIKLVAAMEDMLKMMGIEAGSKSQGPKKQQNAIKAKKKDGVSDGSGMDSKVCI